MSIIKSRYNISNGTDFDTYHFETDIEQVIISASKNLKDVLLGSEQDGKSLSMLKEQGVYLVSNSTDLPVGLNKAHKYYLEVKVVGDIVIQVLYNHLKNDTHTRAMTALGFSEWTKSNTELFTGVEELFSTVETMMGRIKDLDTKANQSDDSINILLQRVMSDVNSHTHDERYVKKTGGTYTGVVELTQSSGIDLRTGNGSTHEVIRVNEDKNIIVGNENSIINIKGKLVTVQGESICSTTEAIRLANTQLNKRLHESAVIRGKRTIAGTNVEFDNDKGSIISVGFDNGIGKDFKIKLGNKELVKITDAMTTVTGKFVIEGAYAKMRSSSSDEGVGFSYSSDAVRITDYQNNQSTFITLDRTAQEVQIVKNSLKIGGVRLSLGSTKPSNPKAGDIWIG